VKTRILLLSAAALAASFAPAALADGVKHASVLIYPVQRSGDDQRKSDGQHSDDFITIVNVTNCNLTPQNPISFGGSTNVHFQYVNTVYNDKNPFQPHACTIFNRTEFLTPADTLSVLTSCHNAFSGDGQQGYLVVSAQNPSLFSTDWSFNHLLGSELVVNGSGGMYRMNAIPFDAIPLEGLATDLNGNKELDFDDVEYEGVPAVLYVDSFLAVAGSRLALINLTGGPDANAVVQIQAWNDNEFPLSATVSFKCWFDQRLKNVNPLFDDDFLANNTPEDEDELDIDCNNNDDYETGWAIIDGIVANTPFAASKPNPALLGAITSGPTSVLNGGDLLWESKNRQLNGIFLEN
jgi:hypothetical protein